MTINFPDFASSVIRISEAEVPSRCSPYLVLFWKSRTPTRRFKLTMPLGFSIVMVSFCLMLVPGAHPPNGSAKPKAQSAKRRELQDVTPAKAGVQCNTVLDTGFRRYDGI